MNELEIIYDHYNNTFNIQLQYISNRNKYFIYLLVLISVLIFNTLYGEEFKNYLLSIIIEDSSLKKLNNSIFETILLYGIIWVLLLYFQLIITVDRGYKYLHRLEKTMNDNFKTIEITREDKFYTEHYTNYSNIVRSIYKYLFPLSILCGVLSVYIYNLSDDDFIYIKVLNGFLVLIIITIVIKFLFRRKKQ